MTLEEIETWTGRSVTIERNVEAAHTAKFHDQAQSPLFRLPAELRNSIFNLSLTTPHKGHTHHGDSDVSYTRRPDRETGSNNVAGGLNVLLSCRRVWLEANSLGLQAFGEAEHSFWLRGNEHKSSDWKPEQYWDDESKFQKFIDKLTPSNRAELKDVHFYVQLYFVYEHGGKLGDALRLLYNNTMSPAANSNPMRRLRQLTVTLRDVSWHEGDFREEHYVTAWLQRLLNTVHALGVGEFKLQVVNATTRFGGDFPKRLQELRSMRTEGQRDRSYSFLPGPSREDESSLEVQSEETVGRWIDTRIPDSCHYTGRKSYEPEEYQAITLTWKRTVPPIPRDNQNETLAVEFGEFEPALSMRVQQDAIEQWTTRWAEEGSLLKFGS